MMTKKNNFNFKKLLTILSLISGFILLFFAYTSNTEIDEGTKELYQTLHRLFILSSIIFILIIIPTVMIYIKDYKTKKVLYQNVKKSKFGQGIHLFDIVNYSMMTIFMILCIFPMIYVIAGSFNQGADYAIGGVYFLPRLFTFENYKVVLGNSSLWNGFFVTISRTVIGTFTALIYTSMVAYAMSRKNLRFKRTFYAINIFTMFFSGGLIPYFLIIRQVGLYDSFLVYIIPSIYSVYHMIVFTSFFKTISEELHDAALVDGAGEFRIFWQIFLPLSKPVLATIGLWLAVGHWNSYFDTMIFTNSPKLETLQYFLLRAIQTSTLTEGMPAEMMMRLSPKTISLAAMIVSTIPILFVFPFIRKNFQSGIMIGSLKG